MKNLQFNSYQRNVGRGGSKKSKLILALPCGVGLKSCLIPAPSPLRGGENLRMMKQERMGQNCHL